MYSLKQKKTPGHRKTQRLSSQVPQKLRQSDVSMVKVVSTARRAVAVRCIGCGIKHSQSGLTHEGRPAAFGLFDWGLLA